MNQAISSVKDKSVPSRRKFLKETFLGAVFLGLSRFAPISRTAVRSDGSPYLFFSDDEAQVIQAVAERLIGKSPLDVNVVERADRFLAEEDEEIREQIHDLLWVFNAPFFAFLFDFRFSSFVGMSPEKQDSYLEDWMTSNVAFRRTGFQALKRLCISMYYTDEKSWREIGFEGMFLPEDRR